MRQLGGETAIRVKFNPNDHWTEANTQAMKLIMIEALKKFIRQAGLSLDMCEFE